MKLCGDCRHNHENIAPWWRNRGLSFCLLLDGLYMSAQFHQIKPGVWTKNYELPQYWIYSICNDLHAKPTSKLCFQWLHEFQERGLMQGLLFSSSRDFMFDVRAVRAGIKCVNCCFISLASPCIYQSCMTCVLSRSRIQTIEFQFKYSSSLNIKSISWLNWNMILLAMVSQTTMHFLVSD